jgi:hypothetical protein
VAQRIKRVADKVWLRSPEFFAAAQLTRDGILELIAEDSQPVDSIASGHSPLVEVVARPTERDDGAAGSQAPTPMSAPLETRDESPPAFPEPPGDAAEQYREIFGMPEPRPRRPWRR